ncbi:DUF397 domain-containing protein [Actinocorallia aurantiaca]|uniref:DUF397 domain-containing protein n=1 Tax=Actinocorallia aurantiaca TaxID=46204 RepID=A0ABN3TXH5_9ACTN
MSDSQILWRKSSYSTNGADCVEVGTWRKSSPSTENGSCVEVADSAQMIAVRDSKNPGKAPLAFSRNAWATFSTRIKSQF